MIRGRGGSKNQHGDLRVMIVYISKTVCSLCWLCVAVGVDYVLVVLGTIQPL